MKVRDGFVSNSSTTSFLIYGVYFDGSEELKKALNEAGKEKIKELDDDDNEIVEELGLPYYSGYESSQVYLGRSWAEIEDDETGLQFKQRVQKEIREYFNLEDENFGTHEEAFRDG
jgi:hypothetical protein